MITVLLVLLVGCSDAEYQSEEHRAFVEEQKAMHQQYMLPVFDECMKQAADMFTSKDTVPKTINACRNHAYTSTYWLVYRNRWKENQHASN